MGLSPEHTQKQRERLERLSKTADLYLQCRPAHEIAKTLGITIKAVYRDFEAIREIWRKKAETAAQAIIASELAKLDRIEREAWEMHDRSKKAIRQETESLTETEKGSYSTVSKTKRTAEPPGKWLEIVLNCMDKRAKLLRLHDPEQSHAAVMQSVVMEITVNSPAEVKQIVSYQKFEEMKARPSIEPEVLAIEGSE